MNQLTVKPILVPFNGSEIEAVQHNGKVFVGVRKTCNEIGIDIQGQMAKIKGDIVLTSCIEYFSTHDSIGRIQEQMFIDLKGYTLWLAGIQESKVKPEIRSLLIAYKLEAAEVLEKHFTNKLQPKSSAEMLLVYAQQFVEQEKRLNKVETTLTTMQETFLQRDEEWRKSINSMLNKAALNLGGGNEDFRNLRTKSYELLEERGRCQLNTRLKNLKQRLEDNGATKTKINNASRMDVIEDDPKLKEIYTTIIKEFSIGALSHV